MTAALRAALYLDFDNVVSALAEGAGTALALRFAQEPALWLQPLLATPARRVLIRRCYMNPAGFLPREDGSRSYFSTFRHALMAEGFEVVDCPRLTRLKNAADIRIALDVLDALAGPAPIEEFILMTSDADVVPLLHRLRAHDRRTRLIAHPEVGRIVRGAADEVVGLDVLARMIAAEATPQPAPPAPAAAGGEAPAARAMAALQEILAEARAPLHLPQLGQMLAARTGLTLRGSDYAGAGSLEALLARLPGVRLIPGEGGGHLLPAHLADAAGPQPEASPTDAEEEAEAEAGEAATAGREAQPGSRPGAEAAPGAMAPAAAAAGDGTAEAAALPEQAAAGLAPASAPAEAGR
ncbi:MAG: NYN domain-containing protein [Rhodovarius sp.]|nr:NYN domain-containing protein [Rhodovarius sp.]